ncbi:hypothetical protein E2C01_022050 [Portunus trituberculatus]|uniref:RNase H type-1 domain-containing protein n=1 Tax=Portunus trituberculatus TaxID=210409 RepID=A0A5B7E5Z7_PORTR|nr:hypothetical protein [Portunus trituberculatus]
MSQFPVSSHRLIIPSQAYGTRPSLPKSFGLRVASLMTKLSIVSTLFYYFHLPRIGYWQLPIDSLCLPVMDGKKYFPSALSNTRFLEHYSTHSDAIPVFTDGSKSDAGVGFGVVLPSIYRAGSLPSVASVFTAELSTITFALQAGLIRKWTTDVMAMKKSEIKNRINSEVKAKQEEKEEETLALTLIHIQGPFFLYLTGIILSFLAIFSEIMLVFK